MNESGKSPWYHSDVMYLWLAGVLYVLGWIVVLTQKGLSHVQMGRYPFFIPTGLLLLAAFNRRLMSKILGWGLFTVSFVCLIVVLGAFVVQMRMVLDLEWFFFVRTLIFYAVLSMATLYQLRFPRSKHSEFTKT